LSIPSIGPKYNVVPDRIIISSGISLDSSITSTSSSSITGSVICAHVSLSCSVPVCIDPVLGLERVVPVSIVGLSVIIRLSVMESVLSIMEL